jgi:hypothetical protein
VVSFASDLRDAIAEQGRPLTIRMRTSGTYDPSTGQTAPAVNTDYAGIPGLILRGGQTQIAGGLITSSKPRVVFSYLDMPVVNAAHVVPTTASVILDGPIKYQISAVRVPEAEGGPVAVVCDLAGG